MRILRRMLPRATRMPARIPVDHDRRVRHQVLVRISKKISEDPEIQGMCAQRIQEIIADEYRQ